MNTWLKMNNVINNNKNTPPHQPSVGKRRIGYLDALKFLGIILVIEGHVWDFGMGIKTYDSVSGMMLYSFNMPIFFFVSGFLAYKDKQESERELMCNIWKKFLF